MKTLTFSLFLLFFFFSLQSQIINVPQDQSSIQSAIEVASNHDTILVAPGEYFENINFKGKNIVVCSYFALTNDPNDITSTIINGGEPLHPDTASCVLIVSGEDSTAVLQGFTLTGGKGTRWEDEHGPNHWYTEGGGVLIQYSSPTIKNNIISDNEAINVPSGTSSAGGGGIRSGDGNPHILNNIISYNQGRYGGGIVMNYSGAIIKNNVILQNSGGEDFGGGGLWFLSNGNSPLILENNTIVNNSSTQGGGGIRLWSSEAIITNNIFWGNTAGSSPQIQGNTGTVSYSCIEGGFAGEGNISEDPGFMQNSFILMDNSPCIDIGESDESYNDPEDPENSGYAWYPAKGTLHSDMGVFGGPGCMQLPDIVTGIEKLSENANWTQIDIFPNPASTIISINVSADYKNVVEIQIYNSNVVLVKQITSFIKIKDHYKIDSDISDLPSGIYYIKIILEDEILVKKIIKI